MSGSGQGRSPAGPGAAAQGGSLDRPVAAAVERVRRGGLVAYPTETLYGLGAGAQSPEAVGRLRAWKGRGEAQPLSVLVAGVASLEGLGLELPPPARRLLEAFWPGPLTVVLPCAEPGAFAPGIGRPGDGAVGVRCSPHPVAAALARALEAAGVGPVTATSLNRHGEPPARTRALARALCTGRAAGARQAAEPVLGAEPAAGAESGAGAEPAARAELAAGAEPAAGDEPAAPLTDLGVPWLLAPAGAPEPGGLASTVVDATGAAPRILREGALSRELVAVAWEEGAPTRIRESPARPTGGPA